MYELTVKGNISSAHYLNQYEGKCKNLHGHNWRVEVIVQSDTLDSVGMVADFGVLKEKLNALLSQLDHVCLNELPDFKEVNPTTENIAAIIYNKYAESIAPLALKQVQVWESENSSVIYRK